MFFKMLIIEHLESSKYMKQEYFCETDEIPLLQGY